MRAPSSPRPLLGCLLMFGIAACLTAAYLFAAMPEAELREAIGYVARKAAAAAARAVAEDYARSWLRDRFGSSAGGDAGRNLPRH
ncbi:hypothetical protein ACWDFL_37350 [Streptomyces bungoensis]